MRLELLNERYAICQADQTGTHYDSSVWHDVEFFAIIKTPDEQTIIVPQSRIPVGVRSENDYVCFRVVGPLEFSIVGVIAGISKVLADAKIPIFVVSTFDTDYVFVKREFQDRARLELSQHGYLWDE